MNYFKREVLVLQYKVLIIIHCRVIFIWIYNCSIYFLNVMIFMLDTLLFLQYSEVCFSQSFHFYCHFILCKKDSNMNLQISIKNQFWEKYNVSFLYLKVHKIFYFNSIKKQWIILTFVTSRVHDNVMNYIRFIE